MVSKFSVTCLTPGGRGAVAVLRVQAQDVDAAKRLDMSFVAASGIHPSSSSLGRILYGQWGPEDVVVVRTEELVWEIHCHGGDAAVDRISQQLCGESGSRGQHCELTQTAGTQRLESSILSQLLKCRTQRTVAYLLAQYQGVLRTYLQQLRDCESPLTRKQQVEDVLKWQVFADHLVEPWSIVVAGQPNAGKSSILNAVVGYERSIVFDQPGTTRDRIEVDIVLDGWPIRLTDTAGIRDVAANEIEATGIQIARVSVQESRACVLVIDSAVGWSAEDTTLLDAVPLGIPVAVVCNKSDLVSDGSNSRVPDSIHDRATVLNASALTGSGLPVLLNWMTQVIVPRAPELTQPLSVVPELTELLIQLQQVPDRIDGLLAWLQSRDEKDSFGRRS